MSETGYRIDYDNVNVRELMEQVQARALQAEGHEIALPPSREAAAGVRLADYLQLDDDRPYELQERLGLGGAWNVSPADLRLSHPSTVGRVIRAVRTLLRPVTKLLANTDLPLYKQFKINIGFASAIQDLMQENARLRHRVGELAQDVERLRALDQRRGDNR